MAEGSATGRWKGIFQSLGPGLLMAGAAIGGSHLVQSTRAGAGWGYTLWWAVFVACLFKYPFFEFGPRYTAATGESFLHGYLRLGKWAMAVFLVFTFCTMFIVEAALTVVTAGLAGEMTGIALPRLVWASIILGVCVVILAIGRYPLLDLFMKIIIVLLAVSTVAAVAALLFHGRHVPPQAAARPTWTPAGIAFVVALMGWMPSIVDISVWYSLWALARGEQTGHRPTLRESLFDFNLGYIGTFLLAFAFLALGALVMFGRGLVFSNNGVHFAGQLVSLYTASLGGWAGPIIGVAAFTTMFSTTLAVIDAYPRVIREGAALLSARLSTRRAQSAVYFGTMALLVAAVLGILAFFTSGIKSMMDFATTVSFLTTPVLAYINFKVIGLPNVPGSAAPPKWLRGLSWAGLAFWTGFAALFVAIRFF
ncbi:MAG: divalent metal cation transporter [Acidobacteriota bacterium]|jgi:Mn2+/Fe2+ NRAMP family transporter